MNRAELSTYRIEPGSVLFRVMNHEARRQRRITGCWLAAVCMGISVLAWLIAMAWPGDLALAWYIAITGPLVVGSSCCAVVFLEQPGFFGEQDYRLAIGKIDPDGQLGAKDWIYLGLELAPQSDEEWRSYHLRKAASYASAERESATAGGRARSRPAGTRHKDPAA